MGFFSWKTSDTKETIWNIYTGKSKPVYLLMPEGRPNIGEPAYDGYGRFGGKDAYALLAEENGLTCEDEDETRHKGIRLSFNKEEYPKAKFHLKFSFDKNAKYEDVPPAEVDPHQGYFG
jgi:hypothetical protein